ncbi:hypothetical protein DOJK_00768 [Patescibacteria group bacterium]|nr:hypothetical protein DOJK_00768 [Patescibacteria group bacterium]
MDELYRGPVYARKNPDYHEGDSNWKFNHILKMITKNNLRPTTIADVGCGAGLILNKLHEHYCGQITSVGYEISPDAYSLCSKYIDENLDYRLESIFDDDQGIYSVVLLIDVLEHVEDTFGFLRQLTKKGERFILHVPLEMNCQLVFRDRPIIESWERYGHIHQYSKSTLFKLLSDCSYTIDDYFYTAVGNEIPNRSWRQRALEYPRRFAFKFNEDLCVRVLGGYSVMVLASPFNENKNIEHNNLET